MSLKQQHEETTYWEHRQRRLVLYDLKKLYMTFCKKHANVSIGFYKLAKLCPKHCIPAGASSTLYN
jgi:hypothetical protein